MRTPSFAKRALERYLPLLHKLTGKSTIQPFDLIEFIKFCCVGVANALVDFMAYYAASWVMSIYWASVVAWCVACTFSYTVNKIWTFQAKTKGPAQFMRFMLVNALSLGLRIGLLYILTGLGLGKISAYWCVIPAVAIANYLGYKLWSFKQN